MGLDGSVRKVPGILPIVAEAKEREVRRCIVPEENKAEAALVSGMQVIGVKDLKETIEFLKSGASRRKRKCSRPGVCRKERQRRVFRILEIFVDRKMSEGQQKLQWQEVIICC